jgi:hypothetical protein
MSKPQSRLKRYGNKPILKKESSIRMRSILIISMYTVSKKQKHLNKKTSFRLSGKNEVNPHS